MLKRILDLAVSSILLVVLSPLLAILWGATRMLLGKPAVYRSLRPGLRGEIFEMYKFRTMTEERDDNGHLLPDEQRLTAFGSWMRAWSLDELPELVNVLRGDMSLVGPRPLLPEYLERYSDEQARRHEVRPGLTGWAQVNGRNETPWPERLEMDVWYVDHRSLLVDLKILLMTAQRVVTRSGISAEGHATKEEFFGEEQA